MTSTTENKLRPSDKLGLMIFAVSAVTLIIWNVPFLRQIRYPFKLLGTWYHEMGHGLTALLLGADFTKLEIFATGSGVAYTTRSGMWVGVELGSALIALGGLLGPAIIGGLMLISGKNKKWSQVSLFLLSFIMLLSVAIWVRTLLGIGIIAGIGVVLLIFAIKGSKKWIQLLVQFMATQAILSTYLQFDYLFMEKAVIGGKELFSDTSNIATNTFGNYFLWGIIVCIITVIILWISFKITFKKGSEVTE